MNHNRKTALIFAALLGAGVLTSCGGDLQQAADTRSMVAEQRIMPAAAEDMRGDLNGDGAQDAADAQLLLQYYAENTLAGNSLTWDQLLGAASSEAADQAAAKRALKRYLDAAAEGDTLGMIEASGLGDLLRMTKGNMKTNEELAADDGLTVNKIDSYTIGEPKTDAQMLKEYQEETEKALEEARAVVADNKAAASDIRTAFLTLSMVKPLTKMYAFPVTLTQEGKTTEDAVLMTCDEKGEWRVDAGVVTSLVRYITKARKSSVYSSAKTVYNAVSSAMIDMDSQEVNVKLLNGDYIFTGADFENVTQQMNLGASTTKEQQLAQLKYLISKYFPTASELGMISVRLQDGICIAVAVQKEFSDDVLIGTYPRVEEIPDGMSVTEAMQKAAEKG